jgi:hypothetical protein
MLTEGLDALDAANIPVIVLMTAALAFGLCLDPSLPRWVALPCSSARTVNCRPILVYQLSAKLGHSHMTEGTWTPLGQIHEQPRGSSIDSLVDMFLLTPMVSSASVVTGACDEGMSIARLQVITASAPVSCPTVNLLIRWVTACRKKDQN